MNAVEKDDFSHALAQTLEFYGKTLESRDFSFWYRALGDKPIASIKEALLEYTKIGKYAPKPADIISLISDNAIPAQQPAIAAPEPVKCPREIHLAWVWFIGMCSKGTKAELFQSDKEISYEQQEKYLHTVNHEAQRMGLPDAIPDEFKLPEVFGNLKTDRIRDHGHREIRE